MSLGSQFLARLQEAKAPKKKGYEFDRGTEAMKRSMRKVGGENDFADKIAEVLAMAGIPGMYLNKADVRDSVIDAAQTLRTKPARVRSFLALHSALSNFHGVTPITEAKGDEEDLEGNTFQQLVQEVLVSLGAPMEMVTSLAKAAVKSGLRRTIAKLRADDAVRAALLAYARYSGIKMNDGSVGMKPKAGKQVKEEVGENAAGADAGNDAGGADIVKDPVQSAKQIMKMFGVDLANDRVFKGDNLVAVDRSMKIALRNPVVKRAMKAFMTAAKM